MCVFNLKNIIILFLPIKCNIKITFCIIITIFVLSINSVNSFAFSFSRLSRKYFSNEISINIT